MRPLTDRFAFRLWSHAAHWTQDGQLMIVLDKETLLDEMRKLGGRSKSVYTMTYQLRTHGWSRVRQSSILIQYGVPARATVWAHSFLRSWSSVELALKSTPQGEVPSRPGQFPTDAAVPQWIVDAQEMEAALTLCGLADASWTADQPEYLQGLTPEERFAMVDSGHSDQAAPCQPYGHTHTEADFRDEISILAEMAEVHICRLELDDLLMLGHWYSLTGSYCLPCRLCRVAMGEVELHEQQQEHHELAFEV